MRSDLLNEIFIGIGNDAAPVGAAVVLCVFNARIESHLFQCGLETSGELAAAKQFTHVGACAFIVKLDGPASGLMRGDRGSRVASFGIGLCFGGGIRPTFLSLPGVQIYFVDQVFQVLGVGGIKK